MGYIALVLAVVIGGGMALYQGWGGDISPTPFSPSDVSAPLRAAEDAVAAIEGRIASEISVPGESGVASPSNTGSADPALVPAQMETMLVAGGCFWCVEADLEKLPGVRSVVSGYAGGKAPNPTYENYSAGGHREVVEVTYDASQVSFQEVLIFALKHMDPTDGSGSFGDRGEYYSPAMYYKNSAEKTIIENLIRDIDSNGPYPIPLAIDVEPTQQFYAAEAYHQDYYKGTLSKLKYQYYRTASGRDAYITKIWGTDTGPTLPWRPSASAAKKTDESGVTTNFSSTPMWQNYVKPAASILEAQMEALAFKVTQAAGTERAGTSPLDKNYERGIYVDILSGEPLFSSKDKFDSGTGWPSFVRPIAADAVTEHVDKTFFSTRTEIRSRIADNHLGHVFPDGPRERGGLRYCMNGVALRFIPEAEMATAGYGDYLAAL